jgi:short-subunit dehydrogenase
MPSLFATALLPFVVLVGVYHVQHYVFRTPFVVHNNNGIIVISGASSGIGRDAAEVLAKQGYHVFAGVRRQADADSITQTNIATLHPLFLDVTDHDWCVEAITTVSEFRASSGLPFVALINNAGITHTQLVEYHDLSSARAIFETHIFGVIDLVQLSLPMIRKDKGRIIMIGSVSGFVAPPLTGITSASKFALEGLSDALRREVDELGVSVSIIQPGYVSTPIHAKQGLGQGSNRLHYAVGARPDVTPDEIIATYPHIYNDAAHNRRQEVEANGNEVAVTTTAIVHAVKDPYPLTRYLVAGAGGLPAFVISWLAWALPDKAEDFVVKNF